MRKYHLSNIYNIYLSPGLANAVYNYNTTGYSEMYYKQSGWWSLIKILSYTGISETFTHMAVNLHALLALSTKDKCT